MFAFSRLARREREGMEPRRQRKSSSSAVRGPRLERRNAAKNIDYEAVGASWASTSSDESSLGALRTRSLDLSPAAYANKKSFRIEGAEGEVDLLCRSLGLAGPEDFAIPAAAWEARKARSSSDLLPRSRLLDPQPSPSPPTTSASAANNDGFNAEIKVPEDITKRDSTSTSNTNTARDRDRDRDRGGEDIVKQDSILPSNSKTDRVRGGGDGRVKINGVRPPPVLSPRLRISVLPVQFPVNSALALPPGISLAVLDDDVSSTWDIIKSFAPKDEDGSEQRARRSIDSKEEEESGEEEEEVEEQEDEGVVEGGVEGKKDEGVVGDGVDGEEEVRVGEVGGDGVGGKEDVTAREVVGDGVEGEENKLVVRDGVEGEEVVRVGETMMNFTDSTSCSVSKDEMMFVISPNGRFKRNIKSWQRGVLLGSGSFGTVYEGISNDGFFFAVKEVSLLDQGSNAEQWILQLEQEIALLSQFEHDNIVQYYGSDKEEAKLYIFLELVTQGSLASLYQKYNLRDSQVSVYTRQILNGLSYLHDRSVVHRDIKCANILVDANGSVKLADFGLAKEITKLNVLKSCKGSVYWMAPEVVNPKRTYGPSADIWSLGCTVLEMLTRQIPYPDLEWAQALYRIGQGESPTIPDSLSKEARDFIRQCVQINPDDRPSASQLLGHPFVKRPLLVSTSSDGSSHPSYRS